MYLYPCRRSYSSRYPLHKTRLKSNWERARSRMMIPAMTPVHIRVRLGGSMQGLEKLWNGSLLRRVFRRAFLS